MGGLRQASRSHLIEGLVVLLVIVGIAAVISTGTLENAGQSLVRLAPPVRMVDGFPIGEPVPCAQHCAEWTRLARSALDVREHGHAEIVGARTFMEAHIPDLYGPGVLYTRSGTLIVVVFDLADGSVRATGVYCGVGGCRGWTEFNVGKVVGNPPVFHASAPEDHASPPQHHASAPQHHASGPQGP
jgi:hypothetical protein